MIKTIIFDLGNVILDIDKTKQFKKFSASSNKDANCIDSYFENSYWRKAFEGGRITPRQFYEKSAKELNLNMNFNEFKEAWRGIFALNKDVEKLIKKLKQNFRLILLSNTDAIHFEYIKKKFKIVNIFDDYVLSYKFGYRKPNPLIFMNAIRKSKTMPFNCVYIDDILEFIYTARLLGIKAFQYQNFEKLILDLKKIKILNNKNGNLYK